MGMFDSVYVKCPNCGEEVKLFEHCYPLDVEKPLKITLAKILNLTQQSK